MDNDWDSVTVLRKKAPTSKDARSEATLNQARRAGAAIASDKKFGAAANRNHATDLNTAKLDRETEELQHKTVGMDVAKAIIKGRQEKGWTQKDLAVV
jgi:putative transcription factor